MPQALILPIASRSIRPCLTFLQRKSKQARQAMSEASNDAPERAPASSFLRQFARRRTSSEPEEHCELCSASLSSLHQHLLDPKKRQIICACDGCAILFCGQAGAHFLRVPRRLRFLVDFQISDLQWGALMVPINLAFFYRDSAADKVLAMYPSPAGATESLFTLESWEESVAQNPDLQTMEPDVEALLVNRIGNSAEYYFVPIDECYRLV